MIVTAAGDGHARGLAIGEQLHEKLPQAWVRWNAHFTRKGVDPLELAQRLTAAPAWNTVHEILPDLELELQAMADAANMPWMQVAALSMLDESWALTGGMACTAIAVTRPGSRAAGQNMDLPAWTNTLQTILNVTHDNGIRVVAATYPGSLATCGTNSHGVVVVVNALDLATDLSGVPVDFVTRGALTQPSAQAAIDFIRSIPHAVGQNYTVIDEHDIFMVEAAADGVIDVPLNDDVSWHTNHALTREHDVSESSRTRWDAVASHMAQLNTAQDVMSILENQESGICQVQGRFGEDMYSFMGIVGDCIAKRTWVNVSPATGSGFVEIV